MTTQATTSDWASWTAIGILAIIIAVLEIAMPLPVAISSLAQITTACVILTAVSLFYRHVRYNERFATMCIALMQVLLFSAMGAVLSYLVARGQRPIWDATFLAWDTALGLDWMAFARTIDANPWAVMPLRLAYGSLIPQIILLILALGFSGKLNELRAVMLAAILCGILVVITSGIFPSIGIIPYLDISSADFQYVDPWSGTLHMKDLTALRDGTMTVLTLPDLKGIITFPSYHAGLSMVTLWGFWLTRNDWLRWPGMTIAAATIVSTPVDGGHYFTDTLGGMTIAILSIAISTRAVHWNPFARKSYVTAPATA